MSYIRTQTESSILSRDAGEGLVGCLGGEVHEPDHVRELCRVALVDRVADVRQLTADLSRRTAHHITMQ